MKIQANERGGEMPSVKEVIEGFEALRFEAVKARGALSSAREMARADADRLSSALAEDLRQAIRRVLEERLSREPELIFAGSPLGAQAQAIAWSERRANEQSAKKAEQFPLQESTERLEAARERSAQAFERARSLSAQLDADPAKALDDAEGPPTEGPRGALALFAARAKERKDKKARDFAYELETGESAGRARARRAELGREKTQAWQEWDKAERERFESEARLLSHWGSRQKTLDESGVATAILAKLAEALRDQPDGDFDRAAALIAPSPEALDDWIRRKALIGVGESLVARASAWAQAAARMQERVEAPLSRWSRANEGPAREQERVEMDLDSALGRAAESLRSLRRAASAAKAARERLARSQTDAGRHERLLAGPPLEQGPTRSELAGLALALSRGSGRLDLEGFGFGRLSDQGAELARKWMEEADRLEGAAGMELGAKAWEIAKAGREEPGLRLDADWPQRVWPTQSAAGQKPVSI